MATTITINRNLTRYSGGKVTTGGTGNLGATYSARGTVLANKFGLGVMDVLKVQPAGGYVFVHDSANTQIDAYEAGTASAALDECDNDDDLSLIVFTWEAVGVG
jgi:hypothetical protein